MSASFTIRPEAAGGYPWVTFEGHITLPDILAAIDALSLDGAYGSRCRLWDFRGCTMDLSGEELREIAEVGAERDEEPGRVALLADSDLIYGLGRMYEVIRSSPSAEYRVFRTEPEALAWLTEAQGDTG